MGWQFPWVSSADSDFNFDYGVSFTERQQQEGAEYNYRDRGSMTPLIEAGTGPVALMAAMSGTDVAGYLTEGPGMSAFALEDGTVYHTYSAFARGVEPLMMYYPLFDRAPKGRNETGPWMRRHDEYA
jgi:predicted dithiol-disulfide oxidoreductase (DUF899 family)